MGYSIHDLFDDNFTSDRIRNYVGSPAYKGNVSNLLIEALGLNTHTFSGSHYLDQLIMLVLEELFSLDNIAGYGNRLSYSFSLIEPGSTLTSVVYKGSLAEVKCKCNTPKQKWLSLSNILFKRTKPFSVDDFLIKLESSKACGSDLSPLDTLLDYLKSLNNKDLLKGIVSGLLYLKFSDFDESDNSLRLSLLFGLLSYDEPFELSRIKYKEGQSDIVVKFSNYSEE